MRAFFLTLPSTKLSTYYSTTCHETNPRTRVVCFTNKSTATCISNVTYKHHKATGQYPTIGQLQVHVQLFSCRDLYSNNPNNDITVLETDFNMMEYYFSLNNIGLLQSHDGMVYTKCPFVQFDEDTRFDVISKRFHEH